MPKSKNKRRSGKYAYRRKKPNGAGGTDTARANSPTRRVWEYPPEIQNVMADSLSMVMHDEPHIPMMDFKDTEVRLASYLYGEVNKDTLRAALSASNEIGRWLEQELLSPKGKD